jgi:transcriptional regulator with XRE-family HTH domain
MSNDEDAALRRVMKETREGQGLSPADVEVRGGLPEGRLVGIERGDRVIRYSDLVAISEVLGTTPSALVERAERLV